MSKVKKYVIMRTVMAAFIWCMLFLGNSGNMAKVWAKEQEEVTETILDKMELNEINEVLDEIFPNERIMFEEVINALLDESETISPELLFGYVTDILFGTVKANKNIMVYLLMLAVVAAVFTNFSNVFQNQQIAETGFYIVYILVITVCLQSFKVSVETVVENLENLLVFMRVFGPAYFLSMTVATGSISGAAFYQMILFLIYLVELLILHFLIPFIHVYLMIQVLNFLSGEEYLSKLAELLETVASWSLKTMLVCVTGISVIQGILSPAIDSVNRSALTRGAEMIPGVGDAIGGMAEVVLGTAVLIKNGIGMAGAVIVIIMCLIPLINMGILTLIYKGLAALIQPISDKRIVEAVASVGAGYYLLLRTVFTTAVLFLITLAVTAASTS